MKQTQQTVWSEFFAPDATSDRGWLKALTAPFDWNRRMDYTNNTMPVFDDEVPGQWREQSTLGNYLDYGADHYRDAVKRSEHPGNIHCVCYVSRTSHYVETVEQAREWIESEAFRVRPELVFQAGLNLTAEVK